eukprot:425180-Alexandrium_andersonii.AAC.1
MPGHGWSRACSCAARCAGAFSTDSAMMSPRPGVTLGWPSLAWRSPACWACGEPCGAARAIAGS